MGGTLGAGIEGTNMQQRTQDTAHGLFPPLVSLPILAYQPDVRGNGLEMGVDDTGVMN